MVLINIAYSFSNITRHSTSGIYHLTVELYFLKLLTYKTAQAGQSYLTSPGVCVDKVGQMYQLLL